jgi:hypothetical protein
VIATTAVEEVVAAITAVTAEATKAEEATVAPLREGGRSKVEVLAVTGWETWEQV